MLTLKEAAKYEKRMWNIIVLAAILYGCACDHCCAKARGDLDKREESHDRDAE